MRKDEKGYIVVETVGSFILFVLLMMSILSIVNIVVLQARIHYAVTQAALTLSRYSYVLRVAGVASEINTIETGIDGIVEGINSLSIDEMESVMSDAIQGGTDLFSDPSKLIGLLMSDETDKITEEIVRPIVGRYLSNGHKSGNFVSDNYLSGDEYLKRMGVLGGLGSTFTGDGLQFFILYDGDISLIVSYDVDYFFGALPLPFIDPYLSITQQVKTKTWAGGHGEGYKQIGS